MPHPRYRERPVPAEVLVAPPSRAESAAEQDAAAGGRERRKVELAGGGLATASVYLHRAKGSRRAYAYVRVKSAGRNHRRYVGDVSAETRADALGAAWRLISEKKILDAWAETIASS